MINKIEIKNFKSIKSKFFPLRNLNLLLGMNGQGKSSFIQALLLLIQSNLSSSSHAKGTIILRGEYVNLGNSKDAFYQYAKDEFLEFNIDFVKPEVSLPLKYAYEIERDVLIPINSKNEIINESLFRKLEVEFGPNSGKFHYLNAFRIEPKAIYPKNNSEVVNRRSIGKDGRYSAHFIETYYDEEVAFDNVLHPRSYIEDKLLKKTIVNKTLINQVNLWLGEISPGINVRTTSINQDEVLLEYVYEQPTYVNTNRFKPENVGFGITYGLPVVTALLSAKPGSLIIIENPESHIHPRGQVELGKLIALVAQNDVQLIIETHSDHILNGIRVAVNNDKLNKEKTILFYFKRKIEEAEQYSQITNIELDQNGELSEYPEGLLDEWSNQILNLM